MKDRTPTQVLPNGAIRYEEFNESEVSQGYKYLKLADEPTEVGTALNKAFGDASFFVTFAHARIGTNNELTNADGGENIRFVVSANTEATDTWTVNGTSYTLKDQSGETYEAELKAGAIVSCFADNTNHVLNFKSGGAGLNFALKPYATEAALLADTPKENTIGIVTATEISGYAFVAATSEITSPATGMVAITEGTASPASFNAIKKNTLTVYPLRCYQYTGSAWAQKTCYVRKGGAWVNLIDYLYLSGNQFSAITGGWTSAGSAYSAFSQGGSVSAASFLTVDLSSASSEQGNSIAAVNAVDLTGYTTLNFIVSSASNNTCAKGVAIKSSRTNLFDSPSASKAIGAAETGTFSIDTSTLNGSFYIGAYGLNNAGASPKAQISISAVWRE